MKCQVTRCSNPHDCCIHTQTGEKYCRSCAMKINRVNPLESGKDLILIPNFVYVVTEENHEWSCIKGIYTSLILVKKKYPSPEYKIGEFGEKGYAWVECKNSPLDGSLCVTIRQLDPE